MVCADVAGDGVLEISNGFEDATPDAPSRDDREKALDSIDPRGRGGREMEDPARVLSQLERTVAVAEERAQTHAVLRSDDDADKSGPWRQNRTAAPPL